MVEKAREERAIKIKPWPKLVGELVGGVYFTLLCSLRFIHLLSAKQFRLMAIVQLSFVLCLVRSIGALKLSRATSINVLFYSF